MQKGMLVCWHPSRDRCRMRMCVTAFLPLPSKPFTVMGFSSWVALMFRNLATSIAHAVSIKANPFAPVSARAYKSTLNPLCDIVQGTVKCFPPINRLRSISWRLIPYPRAEYLPRVPLFPNPPFLFPLTDLLQFPSRLSSLAQGRKHRHGQ